MNPRETWNILYHNKIIQTFASTAFASNNHETKRVDINMMGVLYLCGTRRCQGRNEQGLSVFER